MTKMKWENIGDLYVCVVDDETSYTIEHVLDTKKGGWRCTFTTADDWYPCDSLRDAKLICQRDHSARVAKIALANGYVKLADDEIMMPRVMARELILSRCECCEDEGLSDCGDCDIKPIRDKIKEVTP